MPLTRDDFEVTEDKHPQTIRYFESQAEHEQVQSADSSKAPLIIAILDEVNFPYTKFETNAANMTPGIPGGVRSSAYAVRGGTMDPSYVSDSSFNFDTNTGFNAFVVATGGQDFLGNDVRGEVTFSTRTANMYYTLSYTPQDHIFDGSFRHISVVVKGHPEWHVATKKGYFGLQYNDPKDMKKELTQELTYVTYDQLAFSNIGAAVVDANRISDDPKQGPLTRFTLSLQAEDLQWTTNTATGQREAQVAVSAAGLGEPNHRIAVLSSKAGIWKLTIPPHSDPEKPLKTTVVLDMHVPPKTQRIRFAVRDVASGRVGTTDLRAATLASMLQGEAASALPAK